MEAVFEKTIRQVAEYYGIAGGAMVVVKDGRTIFKECFGKADVESGRPVTSASYFDIASNSKAFTTMLVSQLCDEGKMDWDTPIRTWWPQFKMMDEYAASHITARDMACHRSGLSRHDLVRRSKREDLPSREDYVSRIAYYVPSAGFREMHLYQNQIYAALGYLTQLVEGQGRTWEEMVKDRIAKPLGMEMEFRGMTDLKGLDAALPYKGGKGAAPIRTEYNTCWVNNPCGGIKTNLDSMEKWITMLAAGGVLPDGSRLVSEAQFRQLCTGVISAGVAAPWNPLDKCCSYALGWKNSCYRGHTLVTHGGSQQGFNSNVGFFPELGISYAVMINADGTPLHEILRYLLCDLGLGVLQDDYSDLVNIKLKARQEALEHPVSVPQTPITMADAAAFAGHYWNDGYHDLYIEVDDRPGLRVCYGNDKAPLYKMAEGIFQGSFENAGITADCRFEPDGRSAVMSFSTRYSPTLFHKAK